MQTRNRFRPLCLLLLLAAASACCPCRKYQKLYGAPLVGTRWLLIQLDGEEVANPTDASRSASKTPND